MDISHLSRPISGFNRDTDFYADEFCKALENNSQFEKAIRDAIENARRQEAIEKEAKEIYSRTVSDSVPQSIDDAQGLRFFANYPRYSALEYGVIKPKKGRRNR